MIYHVTTAAEWNNAQSKGFYEVASLHSEGFIHMSKKEQVAGVLERYYKNVPELISLNILVFAKSVCFNENLVLLSSGSFFFIFSFKIVLFIFLSLNSIYF